MHRHIRRFSRSCKAIAYIILLSLIAVLGLARLSYVGMNPSGVRQSRITTHGVFGSIAILPSLHYRCTHRAIDPKSGILRAFWTLVVVNAVGGGIYAARIFDNVIGDGIGVPDISHHIMHGTAVFAAWSYQQGLLSDYYLHLIGREKGHKGEGNGYECSDLRVTCVEQYSNCQLYRSVHAIRNEHRVGRRGNGRLCSAEARPVSAGEAV
jgi:hypothetical protein